MTRAEAACRNAPAKPGTSMTAITDIIGREVIDCLTKPYETELAALKERSAKAFRIKA